jgi:FMN phosphatase YigB (HAD superfamily)
MAKPIKAIFFDIGNTLGTVDLSKKALTPFPNMLDLLRTAHRVFQVPIGVITDIPDDWERQDVEALLGDAGILTLLDGRGIVTSKEAGSTKGEGSQIFEFAARRLGVEMSACLFIDDDAKNVANACTSGMSAIQKVGH